MKKTVFKAGGKYFSLVLRLIVGGTFLLSSVLKYLSIESFDLYVFEHRILGYNTTEVFSRLLIAAEFCLGLMLIAGFYLRFTKYTMLCFLAGFTVYLLLMPLLFDVDMDNCHCFGEELPFTRGESILKNLVLIALLLPVSTNRSSDFRYQKVSVLLGGIIVVTAFMAVNPPSFIHNFLYGEEIFVDKDLYDEALANTGQKNVFSDGKQIVCLYSPSCKYCGLSAKKIHLASLQSQWDESCVKVIFLRMGNQKIDTSFFERNEIPKSDYVTFSADTFLRVTNGKMPVVLFVENGNICHSYQYLAVDEKKLDAFLSK